MFHRDDAIKMDMAALVKVVEELRKYDPQMELSQLLIYLLVVVKPGMNVADLLPATGLSRSALSRNILSLSGGEYRADHRAKAKPGHDLITTMSNPFDARAQQAAPTQKGRRLAEKFSAILHRKETPNGT